MSDYGQMAWVRTTEQIDLRPWSWDDDIATFDSGIAALLMRGAVSRVTEVVRETFESDPPTLSFPVEWGDDDGRNGPAVSDPAMMYVDLPLGSTDEACTYAVSLESAIDGVIDLHVAGGDPTCKVEDEKGQYICGALAQRLRELAQKLDDACKQQQEPKL